MLSLVFNHPKPKHLSPLNDPFYNYRGRGRVLWVGEWTMEGETGVQSATMQGNDYTPTTA